MPEETDEYEVLEDAGFDEGFDPESIKRSSELDIKPRFDLSNRLSDGGSVVIDIVGEPKKVKSPKLPSRDNTAWFVDVRFPSLVDNQSDVDSMIYSMVIPNSLRFSLNSLMAKMGWNEIVNKTVMITAKVGKIETASGFSGQAKTYSASVVEE